MLRVQQCCTPVQYGAKERKQQTPGDPDEQTERERAKRPRSKGQEGTRLSPAGRRSPRDSPWRFRHQIWCVVWSSAIQEGHGLSGVSSASWDRTKGNRHTTGHEKSQPDIRRNVFTPGPSNTRTDCLGRLWVLHLWEQSNLKGPGSKWGLDQTLLEIPSNLKVILRFYDRSLFSLHQKKMR